MSNSPICCLLHYLYPYASAYYLITMHSVSLLLHYPFFFFLVCLFTTNCTRTFWYDQYARGFSIPHKYGVRSPNTFDNAAPRTYSIICISSESCLGSIVGFARLPCFRTLRSAISAKVVLGELLRLCPGSSRQAPQ